MPPESSVIRTPDQRLRVFVSSTLRELEPERAAVRRAIEELHLAPVMFELGARPHPPRSLYRSYLAQSDIFVGLYWERYGWVAPDEEVSGLEDEYLLNPGLPSLIYIKEPAPDREPRLGELLDRIRSDDRSSYKSFSDTVDLARLVQADLATLLAERFDAARARPLPRAESVATIPSPYTPIVGRSAERDGIAALLDRGEVRVLTLAGPGGIGKSRLAIEVSRDVAARGRDVAFVMLEALTDPERVISAIARALGVRDSGGGEGTLEERVIGAVADRDVLLVVDNMEHLLDAAPLLVRLVTAAPSLQILVTSRAPLRIRAERVVDVGPLDLVDDSATAEATRQASAVELFLQRASAVRPEFTTSPRSLRTIAAICRAVDGVPLAIELAAARVRLLSVDQILERLDSALALLAGGARDLPARQRTLRETIRWSVDLLDSASASALYALASFAGTFRLGAAEDVLNAVGIPDPLGTIETLVDASLLARADGGGDVAFRLLSLVRAYGRETGSTQLRRSADDAWIAHYVALAAEAGPGLRGARQQEWLDTLELEVENVAAVGRALIDRGDADAATEYMWSLYLSLWIGGYLGLAQAWSAQILADADRHGTTLAPRTRAIALYYASAIRFWQDMAFDPVPPLQESHALFVEAGDAFGAALSGISIALGQLGGPGGADITGATGTLGESLGAFEDIGDAWGQAMALVMLGRLELAQGDPAAALRRFQRSLELATSQDERLGIVIAQNHRGWARFLSGDLEGARSDFAEGLDVSLALGHDEGIAYGFEGFVGLRAQAGDVHEAGLLLGAAEALRRRSGILNPGAFEFYLLPLGALRAAGHGDALDAAVAEGSHLSVAEALEHIRE